MTKVEANLGEENDAFTVASHLSAAEHNAAPAPVDTPSDVQALLATVMNLVSDNDVMRNKIADALNASAGF